MTRIFVPQPIPETAAAQLEKLGEVTTYPHTDHQIPKDELLQSVRDKEILFAVGEVPYDAAVFEAANALKFVGAMHGSATFVDFAAATARNIPVAGNPKLTARTTAEFTFAGGRHVSAGRKLASKSVHGVHGDPALWQNPGHRGHGPNRPIGGL
jgi:lactate dehydrogenase-like 2-hydroxyacid dehydrogenase